MSLKVFISYSVSFEKLGIMYAIANEGANR